MSSAQPNPLRRVIERLYNLASPLASYMIPYALKLECGHEIKRTKRNDVSVRLRCKSCGRQALQAKREEQRERYEAAMDSATEECARRGISLSDLIAERRAS